MKKSSLRKLACALMLMGIPLFLTSTFSQERPKNSPPAKIHFINLCESREPVWFRLDGVAPSDRPLHCGEHTGRISLIPGKYTLSVTCGSHASKPFPIQATSGESITLISQWSLSKSEVDVHVVDLEDLEDKKAVSLLWAMPLPETIPVHISGQEVSLKSMAPQRLERWNGQTLRPKIGSTQFKEYSPDEEGHHILIFYRDPTGKLDFIFFHVPLKAKEINPT